MVHTFKQYLKKNKINDFDHDFDDIDNEFDDIFKESHMTQLWGAASYEELSKITRNKKKKLNDSVDSIAGAFTLDNDTKNKTTKVLKKITNGSIDFAELQERFRKKDPEKLTKKDFKDLGKFMKDLAPIANERHDIDQVLEVIKEDSNQQAFKAILSFTQKKTKTGWLETGKNIIKTFSSLVSSFASWLSGLGKTIINWIKSHWQISAAVGLIILIVLCRMGLTKFGLGDVCTVGTEIVNFCGRWMKSIIFANKDFVFDYDWNPIKQWYLESKKFDTLTGAPLGGVTGASALSGVCYGGSALFGAATGGFGLAAVVLCGGIGGVGGFFGSYAVSSQLNNLLLAKYLNYERLCLNIAFGGLATAIIRRILIYGGDKTGLYDEDDVNNQLKNIKRVIGFLREGNQMKINLYKHLHKTFRNQLNRGTDPMKVFNEHKEFVLQKQDKQESRKNKKIAMLLEQLKNSNKYEEKEKIEKQIEVTKLGSAQLNAELEIIKVLKPLFEKGRIQKAAKNKKRKEGGLDDHEIILLLDIFGQLDDYDDLERKQLITSNFHVKLLNDYLYPNAKSTKNKMPEFRVSIKF